MSLIWNFAHRERSATSQKRTDNQLLQQFRLSHAFRLNRCLASKMKASAGGEHGPVCGNYGRKPLKAEWRKFGVVINGFHATAHEVGFVPEASPAGIAKEVLPPATVRFRASPTLHRLEIFPIPAHSHMKWEQSINDAIVAMQESFGARLASFRDLRAETEETFDARELAYAQAEVNDN